jgi:pyruvate/2-oxoglutarate dehydrogenase complex dihydrolipoamide dehydrogenase (E3) component
MTNVLKPDICVIGAGSGGLSVAAAAAAFGVEVVLVEKGAMGGDCLNYGCVPSKALLAAGKAAETMRHASRFGIDDVEPVVDFKAVNRHVHDVIASIAPNDSAERFAALGVRVIEAEGRFIDRRTLEAGGLRIRPRRFVIATGSRPRIPAIDGLDTIPFLTNETIFDLKRRPAHLVIIGGGPIAAELAQAYIRLGAKVTIIEHGRFLSKEDTDAAAIVAEALRQEGVDIREGVKVVRVEIRGKTGIRAIIRNGETEQAVDGSHILVATGRVPSTHGLGLEKAGIRVDEQGIKVSDRLRTSNRRAYAIGDVAGGPQFTHLANHHAGLVIRAILFRQNARLNLGLVPAAVYTDPEIARIGMREDDAFAAGLKPRILRWPYGENDRAQAERRTPGHIKLLVDAKETILGVSIVGAGASEMIDLWALAMAQGCRLRDVANLVLPYPTMSEIGKRASMTYFSPLARRPLVRLLVRVLRIFG